MPDEPVAARRPTATLPARIGGLALANAMVAALGFAGSGLLLPNVLDARAFAAASLFLAAFQCLQEVMGKSLVWAVLRLHPVAVRERGEGSGEALLHAAHGLQRRLLGLGAIVAAGLGALAHGLLDREGEPSRALVLGLGAVAAAFGVGFQFDLGLRQLRERFVELVRWMLGNAIARLVAWSALAAVGALDLTTALAAHLLTTAVFAVLARHPSPSLQNGLDEAEIDHARRRVSAFGGRMVLATALAATAAQVDLWLLDARGDDEATGRLRLAVLFGTAVELATTAVMTALLPQAGRARDAGERHAMLRRATGAGAVVALLALVSIPAVQFALPVCVPRWAAAADLYPVIAIGVIATASTDPAGLSFLSLDRPMRYVVLNAGTLLIVVLGNLLAPGDDRAWVTAWVRTASRIVLALGITAFVLRDLAAARRHARSC